MDLQASLSLALLTCVLTLIGYFVSSSLERWKAVRLRQMEFRLDRYREFLLSFGALSGSRTFETQLRFVDSVNVILLIGSADLLRAVKELVDNYNDEAGTVEKEQSILERILFQMRCDLKAGDSKQLADFAFPIIRPDTTPEPERKAQKR